MAQNPSVKAKTLREIIEVYDTVDFPDALGDFIAGVLNNMQPGQVTRYHGKNIFLPFSRISVYHSMKFTKSSNLEHLEIVDAIHTRPEQRDSHGRIIPSRFDTVLVKGREQTGQGNKGM
jgi:hypothetical protein